MSNIDLNDADQNLGEGGETGALGNITADEQDIILAAEGIDKKRRSGPLILIGVVVLAAGSLFSMRTLTRVQGKTSETPMNPVITGYLEKATDASDLVAKEILAQLTDVKPRERLWVRDPFPPAVGGADPGDTTIVTPIGGTEPQWQSACKRGADKLKVTSVMRDLLANINKTIVQLGGTIVSDGIEFRIVEINNEGITVEAVHAEHGWRYEQLVGVKRGF